MVLVGNLYSILRSAMGTETSDSINPAYEFTLAPVMYSLHFQSERTYDVPL